MHVDLASWNIAKASVQGLAHKETKTECQDVHQSLVTDAGALIIAVADGAGSASHARQGAELAVTGAVEHLAEILNRPEPLSLEDLGHQMVCAFERAYELISKEAEASELPIARFHATLTCVVAQDSGVVIGKIGDGVVVGLHADESIVVLSYPESGEYVNSTWFITHLRTHPVDIQVIPSVPIAIAAATDGILDVGFDDPYKECIPWEQFFRPLFQWVSSTENSLEGDALLAGFLKSDQVQNRSDDDLTLVIAAIAARQGETKPAEPDVLSEQAPGTLLESDPAPEEVTPETEELELGQGEDEPSATQ